MGWAVGYDDNLKRDIGYGVPAICDHPGCTTKIDRGLSYVCGGEPYGGEHGCGLHFCNQHLEYHPTSGIDDDCDWAQLCQYCREDAVKDHYDIQNDCPQWMYWKLTDYSWQEWRDENPNQCSQMRKIMQEIFKDPT